MRTLTDAPLTRREEPVLRPARPEDAQRLTELALRSKAHWGYDPAFLEACRDELAVTESRLGAQTVVVAELRGEPVGFYQLEACDEGLELAGMFVEPASIGLGLGRRLMEDCLQRARSTGATSLVLDSDPNAEPFYLRMGFETVGRVPSQSIPGRSLPRMRRRLRG